MLKLEEEEKKKREKKKREERSKNSIKDEGGGVRMKENPDDSNLTKGKRIYRPMSMRN